MNAATLEEFKTIISLAYTSIGSLLLVNYRSESTDLVRDLHVRLGVSNLYITLVRESLRLISTPEIREKSVLDVSRDALEQARQELVVSFSKTITEWGTKPVTPDKDYTYGGPGWEVSKSNPERILIRDAQLLRDSKYEPSVKGVSENAKAKAALRDMLPIGLYIGRLTLSTDKVEMLINGADIENYRMEQDGGISDEASMQ